jgi:hypothetical protein
MDIRNIKLPSFNGVGASQTAVLSVPVGPFTYHNLKLYYTRGGTAATSAQIEADITKVRLKINGTTELELTGEQARKLAAFYGLTAVNGVIPLMFRRPMMKTVPAEEQAAIGTANVKTFDIEVDFSSSFSAGALVAYAAFEQAAKPLGMFAGIKTFTIAPVASGDFEFGGLPKDDYVVYAAHAFSALATNIQLIQNNEKIDSIDVKAVRDAELAWLAARVPQTNVAHWCADLGLGRWNDARSAAVADNRFIISASGSGNIPLVFETISQPLARAK